MLGLAAIVIGVLLMHVSTTIGGGGAEIAALLFWFSTAIIMVVAPAFTYIELKYIWFGGAE